MSASCVMLLARAGPEARRQCGSYASGILWRMTVRVRPVVSGGTRPSGHSATSHKSIGRCGHASSRTAASFRSWSCTTAGTRRSSPRPTSSWRWSRDRSRSQNGRRRGYRHRDGRAILAPAPRRGRPSATPPRRAPGRPGARRRRRGGRPPGRRRSSPKPNNGSPSSLANGRTLGVIRADVDLSLLILATAAVFQAADRWLLAAFHDGSSDVLEEQMWILIARAHRAGAWSLSWSWGVLRSCVLEGPGQPAAEGPGQPAAVSPPEPRSATTSSSTSCVPRGRSWTASQPT